MDFHYEQKRLFHFCLLPTVFFLSTALSTTLLCLVVLSGMSTPGKSEVEKRNSDTEVVWESLDQGFIKSLLVLIII